MGLSQASIFLLTFIAFGVLVVIVKKNRNLEVSVVEYSFGYSEYVDEGHDEVDVSGLLHTAQALKKAAGDGSMSVVHVEFPKSNQGFIVMYVRVLNYNSHFSNAQLVYKEDDKFVALISEGAIGTGSITIELNSYLDIDCDVEFYGYKNDS